MRRALGALLAAGLAVLFMAGLVHAQARVRTTLKLQPVPPGAIGQPMTVTAVLTEQTGAAIAGAEVVFSREAGFLNSLSELEIGRAKTDAAGSASVTFVPRSEGKVLLLADYKGDARYSASSGTFSVEVATGGPLYSEQQGVKVPGINVSLLVAIVGAVWVTYFAVMGHIFLIARGGRPRQKPEATR